MSQNPSQPGFREALASASGPGERAGRLAWLAWRWNSIPLRAVLNGHSVGGTLTQRFLYGSYWSLIGAGGTQVFTLLASVFTARVLGREAFGQFSLLMTTVVTAATLTGFGLGLTATRYVAHYRLETPGAVGGFIRFVMTVGWALSGVAGVAMGFSAPYLAKVLFGLPELEGSIRWAALYLLCTTVNGVQMGVLAGFENFRAIAAVNIARSVVTLLLTIPLVWLWSLKGAAAAMAIGAAFTYGLGSIQVASVSRTAGIRQALGIDWRHAHVLWTFSAPSVLGGAAVSGVSWVASLWLSRQPDGYAEVGLFGAANQWRSAVAFLPAILSQPLLPLLSSLADGARDSFRRLLLSSTILNGAVAASAGLVLLLAMPFVTATYGKDFSALDRVLAPLIAAAVISCAASAAGNALASQNRMWTGFALNLIWACCLLSVAAVAVPAAGARGLAYSFVASYLVHLLTTGYCVIRWGRTMVRPGSDVALPRALAPQQSPQT